MIGPNLLAKYDFELSALDGIGLADTEIDTLLSSVLAYVNGAGHAVVDAQQAAAHTGQTDDQWWDAQAPLLEKVFDAARFPVAARVASGRRRGVRRGRPGHAFEFGLQRLLDGIEAFVPARANR